jgi:(4-(4-[2-(gamma-L-glutamylamino)ethyl]phenoxymethyl)furan-2-yl)methanamine synthase
VSKLANPKPVVGWDIGGAHLKAVLLSSEGEIVQILQLTCPLWKGLNYLEAAINDALRAFAFKLNKQAPSEAASNLNHAITMTGELVDLFENRQQGVIAISTLVAKLLGEDTFFYAANSGFVALEGVSTNTALIGSTNWHASASALAMHVGDALLIDIGSTTTDIIPIENGLVALEALSDAARLQNDTLVYTGVVRTPIMALSQKLPFEGVELNVMAEYFATMADVYRLTGELKTDAAETADGKGKTPLESARRLARMVGHDAESKPMETWINLANTCKALQMNQIKTAVLKHLKPNMTIVGAGAGSFLVEQIAHELKHEFMQAWEPAFMRLAEHVSFEKKHDLEVCFPAYAVAELVKQHA